MPSGPLPPVFVLNLHADYRCVRAGACCTAGWHIPIERAACDHIRAKMATRQTFLMPEASYGEAVPILAMEPDGACTFFDRGAGNVCAIHRDVGHAWLPVACQQFPRVTLFDARGVHVAFSHFCPTAARMLFRDDCGAVDIVRMPDGMTAGRRFVGFDARATVPPFLRLGVAFDLESYAEWERGLVRHLAQPRDTSDGALADIARAGETLRGWTPARGPLAAETVRVMSGLPARVGDAGAPQDLGAVAGLYAEVAATVPPGLVRPELPERFEDADARWIQPAWDRLARPAGRFLAAKAFGAWSAYTGHGVRTQVAVLAASLAVLRVESARHADAAGRHCDESILFDAIRASDALIEHRSDRDAWTRRLAALERQPRGAFLGALGLKDGPA